MNPTTATVPAAGVPELDIADRLVIARRRTKLDTRAFAERAGMSRSTVSNYENADYARARKPLYLRAWAMACGVSYKWLATGEIPEPNDPSDLHNQQVTGIPGNGVRYLTRAGDVGVPTVPPLAA
jgi:transcriptional regulator with XRE-family HTH domain